MHCLNRKSAQRNCRVSASWRAFDYRLAGFQLGAAVLNGFSAYGTPTTKAAGQVFPEKRKARLSPGLCN